MKIIGKKPAGTQPVYDIGVPETHNFVLDNGLVASNCFNKSHSVSYSMLTYICAWLKANHPAEFFCSLMSVRSQSLQPKIWADKAPEYLSEARTLGVEVTGPQINGSELGFTIDGNQIYFGFNAIRDVGKTAAKSITRARGKVPFKDVFDFLARVNRTKVTRKVFQALTKSGAFDRMGYLRQELLEKTDELYDYLSNQQRYKEKQATLVQFEIDNDINEKLIEERDKLRAILKASLRKRKPERALTTFEESRLNELEELKLRRKTRPKEMIDPTENPPSLQRVRKVPIKISQLIEQADYIGCFVGKHPAHTLFPNTTLITQSEIGDYVQTAGMVSSVRVIKTRTNKKMAFLKLGDETGVAEIILFPSTYAKLMQQDNLPSNGDIIQIRGKCEAIDPMIKIIGNKVDIYRGNI